MKKVLSVIAVLSCVACSTTAPVTKAQTAQPVQPVANTYVAPQEIAAKRAVDAMPEWFMNLPKSDTKIYAVGDGVSGSMSGALSNARANAFEGICQAAGGKVRSQTKVFRQDTESSSTSVTTTAIRNICPDVDVTGSVVEGNKIIQEGNRFRAYILVALPIGESNVLARTKQADKIQEKALGAREREFKELDRIVDGEKADPQPQSKVEGINLLDVDNKDYKVRRDAALQKDGAVIGQIVVR